MNLDKSHVHKQFQDSFALESKWEVGHVQLNRQGGAFWWEGGWYFVLRRQFSFGKVCVFVLYIVQFVIVEHFTFVAFCNNASS